MSSTNGQANWQKWAAIDQSLNGGWITADEYVQIDFPPVEWIVPGLVTSGTNLLAGASKHGKTFFALDVAVSVALGRPVAGNIEVQKGKVLYLTWGSEGHGSNVQGRIKKLSDGYSTGENLLVGVNWRKFQDGGEDIMESYLDENPDTRLVVIDTLKKIRPANTGKRNVYDEDYEALEVFSDYRTRFGTSFLILHHTNKRPGAEDPFDIISGSMGIPAAVDTPSVWKKSTNGGATMYVRGRNAEELEVAFEFDADEMRWICQGASEKYLENELKVSIVDTLKTAGEAGLSPKEISQLIDENYDKVSRCLTRMALGDSPVKKLGRGQYAFDEIHHALRTTSAEVPF